MRPLRAAPRAEERLLWRRFREAASTGEFLESWLAIQCSSVEGTLAGLVLTRSAQEGGALVPAAAWPAEQAPGDHVRAAARRVFDERRPLALELDAEEGAPTRTVIAQPVEVGGEIEAVVVLDVAARPAPELEHALRQLHWGCAWLELRGLGKTPRSGDGLAALLEMVSTPLEQEGFGPAASAFVNDLAARFRCERVSLGVVRRGRVVLAVTSHAARFDARANLTRRIESAMEEVVDRAASVVWPDPSATASAEAHAALAGDAVGVASFPVARGSEIRAVVTLERQGPPGFTPQELELADAAVELAGGILELQRRDERALAARAVDSARAAAKKWVGPRHVAAKLAACTALLLLVFLALAKGEFRVGAGGALEARELRAAVAPFDGYILEAPVRAGDLVAKGDLLVLLDDRDLELDYLRHAGLVTQFEREYRQALAERDAARVQILGARIDQHRAQRDLATDQLSRARIPVPFDGIVVTGDLSQKLGSPVQRGDLLFEVAPLDRYRAVLQVDERDVDEIAVGQNGHFVFAAFPDETVPIQVEKITPVSTSSEGRNTFRVEASLLGQPERLRPGMQGVAKVDAGRRRLIWIWTHEVVDWLRLTLWSWTP